MWPFRRKKKKKTYVTTSDGSIGFYKEDYLRHYVTGCYAFYIKIELKHPRWGDVLTHTLYVEYGSKAERDIALKSLNEILTQQNENER